MKKEKMRKCEYCGKELKPLNPPIEEYVEYKFIFKIPLTEWKLMLLKDSFEFGCPDCIAEKQRYDRYENNMKIYYEGIKAGYEKAMREKY
jgi:predicted RNA-binding Zn-ribbon protein involved in translation (DUF1610 family)